MAKDFLALLKSRSTCYDFGTKDVSEADLLKILEAARWSPSFLNLQPWEFVVVRDRKNVNEMMKAAYYGMYHVREFKNLPPLVVAIVLKKKYWEGQFGYPNRDKPGIFESYLSVAMPAMNMALQAEELGIASAMLNVDAASSAKALMLRGGDSVPLIVAFGYRGKGADGKKRARKPLGEIVSYEFSGQKK